MITNVSLVSVWVTDLDEALAFYTDILGFEARDDIGSARTSDGSRWVMQASPSSIYT